MLQQKKLLNSCGWTKYSHVIHTSAAVTGKVIGSAVDNGMNTRLLTEDQTRLKMIAEGGGPSFCYSFLLSKSVAEM